jgi:hypothetical protein
MRAAGDWLILSEVLGILLSDDAASKLTNTMVLIEYRHSIRRN